MIRFITLLAAFFSVVSSQSDCGKRNSTRTVDDLDDFGSFDTCSTLLGSLYLYTTSDSEYDNITMPSALQSITGTLYCSGQGLDQTTDSIEGNSLSTVASDQTDSGTIGFEIVDYPTLTLLSFPRLNTVGSSFVIARNQKLTTIEFPSLTSVKGNVDITGSFQSVNMTSLTLVNGNINLQSSYANFVCPRFDNITITGTYACAVNVDNPQPLPADNSSTIPTSLNASATATSVSASLSSTVSSPTSSATGSSTTSSASSISSSGLAIYVFVVSLGFILGLNDQ